MVMYKTLKADDQIIKTKIQNTSKKYIPKKQRKLNNVSSINNE